MHLDIFYTFAQKGMALESVLSVIFQIGAVAVALISFIVTMWSRRKQQDDKAQAEELKRYSDEAVNKLVPVVTRLEQADKFRESHIADFKRLTEESLKQLYEQARAMSQQCVRQQHVAQGETIIEIKKELQRFSNRMTRLDESIREHQETSAEKYITSSIYYRDLKNWSDTFQEVRTSLRDLSAIMVRMLEARDGTRDGKS